MAGGQLFIDHGYRSTLPPVGEEYDLFSGDDHMFGLKCNKCIDHLW